MHTFAHCIQVAFIPPEQRLLRCSELSEDIADNTEADPEDIVITPWYGDGYPDWDFRLTAFANGSEGCKLVDLDYGSVGYVEVSTLSGRFDGGLQIESFKSRFLEQKQFARHLQSEFKMLTQEQALDLASLTYDELLKPDENGKPEVPHWFIDKAWKKDLVCLNIADCSGGIYMRLQEQHLNEFEKCVFADSRTNPLIITASWYSYADPKNEYSTFDAYEFDDYASFHIYGTEPD